MITFFLIVDWYSILIVLKLLSYIYLLLVVCLLFDIDCSLTVNDCNHYLIIIQYGIHDKNEMLFDI